MKLNLKTLSLTVVVGSLLYFLSHYKNNKTQITSNQNEQTKIIDKKPSKLPAPKVYISSAHQNRLGIGSNWKSR
jgi:hypothetical protein